MDFYDVCSLGRWHLFFSLSFSSLFALVRKIQGDWLEGGGGAYVLYEPKKKAKDRREGNGWHCCLGGRIDSIPCRASYLAPGQIEE